MLPVPKPTRLFNLAMLIYNDMHIPVTIAQIGWYKHEAYTAHIKSLTTFPMLQSKVQMVSGRSCAQTIPDDLF